MSGLNWTDYFWGPDVSEREMDDREWAYQAFKARLLDETKEEPSYD